VGLKIENEWKVFHLLLILQCFIREEEEEEEELFLVFGILFNLHPGMTLLNLSIYIDFKMLKLREILEEITVLQLTWMSEIYIQIASC